jgi:aspartate racemase
MALKKVGIVGGVSWRSTLEYYAGICGQFEKRKVYGDLSNPEIAIESLDLNKAVSFLGSDGDESSWEFFDAYHRDALLRLQASGAQISLIASNTPHHRFDSIVRGTAIPVINIFDVTAQECARRQIESVLILGSGATMSSDVVRARFAAHGVDARGPGNPELRSECIRFIEMLQWGNSTQLIEPISLLAGEAYGQSFRGQPTVCLSCTELPLAFPDHRHCGVFTSNDIQYLNSTALHIEALLAAI